MWGNFSNTCLKTALSFFHHFTAASQRKRNVQTADALFLWKWCVIHTLCMIYIQISRKKATNIQFDLLSEPTFCVKRNKSKKHKNTQPSSWIFSTTDRSSFVLLTLQVTIHILKVLHTLFAVILVEGISPHVEAGRRYVWCNSMGYPAMTAEPNSGYDANQRQPAHTHRWKSQRNLLIRQNKWKHQCGCILALILLHKSFCVIFSFPWIRSITNRGASDNANKATSMRPSAATVKQSHCKSQVR